MVSVEQRLIDFIENVIYWNSRFIEAKKRNDLREMRLYKSDLRRVFRMMGSLLNLKNLDRKAVDRLCKVLYNYD